MFVLNRNTYNAELYGMLKKVELTQQEFYIVEILQSGKVYTYYDIARWLQSKTNRGMISRNALKMAISRLRKKGFEININNYSEFKMESECWIN